MNCWRCGCEIDSDDAKKFDTSLYSEFKGSGIHYHCVACITYIKALLRYRQ